jgi:hypothetical protein
MVVGFMGVFMLIMGMFTSYAFQQAKYGRALLAREQALHIAEAGLEYYRWFLAHNPGNLQNGTGQAGPYTYTVNDPEGGTLGSASLTVKGNSQCGVLQNIDITSTGTAANNPGFPRTVSVRYMQHSVAEYAFLTDSSIWYNSGSVVGPAHSNNGMRMDAWSNSNITAAVSTMTCDLSFGCSSTQTKPGVWGNSTTTALWSFPVASIDFAGMASDFPTLKGYAQTYGVMLNPTSVTRAGAQQGSSFSSVGASDQKGFHLVFKSNGTVDVYRVTATNGANTIYSYNDITGGDYSYPVIVSETLVANVTLPPTCALIYSQAKTWIDGTVSGKVTLLAADSGSYTPDIILNNNISYASTDGTSGLTAIAEGSIKIGLVIPDAMTVRGIYVAQTGNYGRDYYLPSPGYLPSQYYSYNVRSSLTTIGTIVSKRRPVDCWSNSASGCDSGIVSDIGSYDQVLAFDPPPFTPVALTDYRYVLWNEH